jgi:hypothetical protein
MAKTTLDQAYREGMALAPIGAAPKRGQWRIYTGERAAAGMRCRWWCVDAERARILADELRRELRSHPVDDESGAAEIATLTASALGVMILTDSDVEIRSRAAVEKIEAEFKAMQQRGDLRSVNGAYRECRLADETNGRAVVGYNSFMRRYLANIVRQAGEHWRRQSSKAAA